MFLCLKEKREFHNLHFLYHNYLLGHRSVQVVFYRVFCPTLEHLSNLSPLVTVLFLQNEKYQVFLSTPLSLFDFWVEMVVPPLATLLTYFARKVLGNFTPVACPLLLYKFDQKSILVRAP